jgi:hypothetical protein
VTVAYEFIITTREAWLRATSLTATFVHYTTAWRPTGCRRGDYEHHHSKRCYQWGASHLPCVCVCVCTFYCMRQSEALSCDVSGWAEGPRSTAALRSSILAHRLDTCRRRVIAAHHFMALISNVPVNDVTAMFVTVMETEACRKRI